ncbi:MAG: c-type cytochrome [Anaerolineales bacterium]|nr:c-type cytochrome [Anaerolineales bacterium]
MALGRFRLTLITVSALLFTSCQVVQDVIPTASPIPILTSTATIPPTSTKTQSPVLQLVGPDLVEDGREIYQQTCASCHGSEGVGYANEIDAPALDASEHAFEHPDQQIHDWITNGKLGLGRQMPGFGDALDDREIHAVIAYLHTLWTTKQLEIQQDLSARWPATPEPTWTPRP